MPTARTYPLPILLRDCVEFYRQTGRRVSFAYCLIDGVNDHIEHAAELATVLKEHQLDRCHVNLIPYNAAEEDDDVDGVYMTDAAEMVNDDEVWRSYK